MYNVTIAIDPRVEQEWVQWMIKSHIPDVIATGSFLSHSMQKVLSGDEDNKCLFYFEYRTAINSYDIEEKYLTFVPNLTILKCNSN